MITIILAAGFSTRLYPLTKDVPKGLLSMGQKQIASYVVEDVLSQTTIQKTYLITSSCFVPSYQTWVNNNYKDKIEVMENGVTSLDKKLGAIGDLLYVIRKKKIKDDILVVPSDTLTSLKLKDFLAFFLQHKSVTTAVYKTDDKANIAGRLGCAVLKNERIVKFVEKPASPPSLYMAVPYYVFPASTISEIEEYEKRGGVLDSPGSILSWFVEKIPVYAYKVKGYYYDVGTPQVYRELREKFNRV